MTVRTPALTLYQPWASLMALGVKRIETRSWSTRHRGTLAIHSAREFPQEARVFARSRTVWDVLYLAGVEAEDTLRAWPLGMVLCTVELEEVVPAETIESDESNSFVLTLGGTIGWRGSRHDVALGDFSPGRFAWLTSNRWRFRHSVYAIGHQGIWSWEHDGKLLRPTVYS